MTTAADAYANIVDNLTVEPDVAAGRMFRSEGLHVRTRYFALLTRGELVVKLPAERAAELAAAGTGEPFEPSPGRAMREWLTLADAHLDRWPALVDEALAYARALGPKPSKNRKR
jgi:TfoX/Sxy family transcriptional regulator of competence genes